MSMPINGEYSYRFNGFSKKGSFPFHIVGIGIMNLSDGIILDGYHSSTIIRLSDFNDISGFIPNVEFNLSGKYCEKELFNNMWSATVIFTQVYPIVPIPQILEGKFTFCSFGVDRYSIISTGAKRLEVGGETKLPNEVVSGEIVRNGP